MGSGRFMRAAGAPITIVINCSSGMYREPLSDSGRPSTGEWSTSQVPFNRCSGAGFENHYFWDYISQPTQEELPKLTGETS
jgi:hypothetical protein